MVGSYLPRDGYGGFREAGQGGILSAGKEPQEYNPAGLKKPDPIYQPEHYTRRNPQPIDVIEAWKLDFWLGQVVKYVGRAGFKDGNTELEDLKKARFYLDRKITILKGEMADRDSYVLGAGDSE